MSPFAQEPLVNVYPVPPCAASLTADGGEEVPGGGPLMVAVRLGDVVVVLEAMKMQNDIVATLGGTVREVFAKEGAIVAPNEVLMTIG